MKVFVFQSQNSISKAGKPYIFQPVQIVQSPKHPDVMSRRFVATEAEVLKPGTYECEFHFRDTPTGLRPVFENFKPV